MSTHISDIPTPFYCYVRAEYLYNHTSGHGHFVEAMVYGLSSIPGRAWGLSALLNNGALVQHLPVSAIVFKTPPTANYPLDFLQVWNCYGWEFAAHEYKALAGIPVKVYMKEGKWENGEYLFTAAPYNDHFSSAPDQHKHFNFVKLDCGLLCTVPGNRMLVYESSFVTIPDSRPQYKTNTHVWKVEGLSDSAPFDSTISPESSL
jgi:hypothetical protein